MNRPPPSAERTPIVPARVRRIAGQSFAFVPHRFLRDRFFASLSDDQQRLYFLLVLAADRFGVSYYHHDTICTLLRVPLERYLTARKGLIDADLIAFDGTRFQVLSLPARPTTRSAPPTRPALPARGGGEWLDSTPPRSQPPPPNRPPPDQLPIAHRDTHLDPAAHPDCRDCQSSQTVRQLLRDTIAALELKAGRLPTTSPASKSRPPRK